MGLEQGELEKFTSAVQHLDSTIQTFNNATQGNKAEVHINAGGVGVLIVTGLAAFMCGLCICLVGIVWHQQKVLDDLHDYLNVIYQYAPQLKPKDFK